MVNITGDQDILNVNDSLIGGLNDDWIKGLTGEDTLFGGKGNDSIRGGDGDDKLAGNEGDDVLRGDKGNDILLASEGNDTLYGGEGQDTLRGDFSAETMSGGDGDDLIVGNGGDDELYGDGGQDTIWGSFNDDFIFGGNGNDAATGAAGNDLVFGDDGDDYLKGGSGIDVVNGGKGDDTIFGDGGNDNMFGDDGDDKIDAGDGDDTIFGGAGGDQFFFIQEANARDIILDYDPFDINEYMVIDIGTGGAIPPTPTLTQIIDPLALVNGVSTIVDLGANHLITLRDVKMADLTAGFGGGNFALTAGVRITGTFKGTASGENNSFGFYVKNGAGVPGQGRLIWNDVKALAIGDTYTELVPGAVSDFGFFILNGAPASTLPNGTVLNFVPTIGQTGGTGYNAFNGALKIDINDGSADAFDLVFFDDDTFNDDFESLALPVGRVQDPAEGSGAADLYKWEDDSGGTYNDLSFTQTILPEFNGTGVDPLAGGIPPAIFDKAPIIAPDVFEDPYSRTDIIPLVTGIVLQGGAGDDSLDGTVNADFLLGETGWDTINGFDGDDTIEGGDGDDSLNGGAGNDLILGEDGRDSIDGGSGDDFILGGAGDDTILAGANDDFILGGWGDDSIDGGSGKDIIIGELGADTLTGGAGDDLFVYTLQVDSTQQDSKYDLITDFVQGQDLIVVDGLLWNQIQPITPVVGGLGYVYDAVLNQTIITASAGNFELRLTGNIPLTNADFIGLTLEPPETTIFNIATGDATTGNDSITGTLGEDEIYGDAGNDTLVALDGDDYLEGGDGDDLLQGMAGMDTLYGGDGSDTLDGGVGAPDEIDIASWAEQTTPIDANLTTGIATGIGTDGIAFTDVLISIEALDGGDGSDILTGSGAAEEAFQGGLGSDTIDGKGGVDAVVYEYSSTEVLIDLDLGIAQTNTAGDVDTLISIEAAGGSLRDDTIYGSSTQNNTLSGNFGLDTLDGRGGINEVTYDYTEEPMYISLMDGEARTLNPGVQDIDVLINFQNVSGGDGNDTIIGDNGNNVITEYDGNNQVFAAAGDDFIISYTEFDLQTPSGDDWFDGGDGNDTIFAGIGNDLVLGDLGDDLLNAGMGNDIVFGGDGIDTIFGDEDNDFINGGDGDDSIEGNLASDTLEGDLGTDTLTGGAGNDVFLYKDKDHSNNTTTDLVTDFVQLEDQVDVSALGYSVVVAGVPILNQLGYTYNGGTGITTLRNQDGSFMVDFLGNIPFIDADFIGLSLVAPVLINGTAGNDALAGGNGNDSITAGAGDDSVDGGAGNDTLVGGLGNDTLNGNAGNDLLLGGSGNDWIDGGAGFDTISFAGEAIDVVADMSVGQATIGVDIDTYINIEALIGGSGNDSLVASNAGNNIYGGVGNDTLIGGTGNDILDGEAGFDSIEGGDGNDFISGGAGDDILNSGLGNDIVYGEAGNDTIDSSDGDDFIDGGSGNDSIDSGIGNDIIVGGLGRDTITGGLGSDIFVYTDINESTNVNPDTITDFTKGTDLVNLSGLPFTTIVSGVPVGTQLGYSFAAGVTTLVNAAGTFQISFTGNIAFDDTDFVGLAITDNQIINGTPGNDPALNGGTGDDTITGDTGNDTLNGNAGDDVLDGQAGDDLINGNGGNDSLIGGLGDDTIDGGAGTDTLSYDYSPDLPGGGITVNMTGIGAGSVTVVTGDVDIFTNVEVVSGSFFSDIFNGSAADDNFIGFDGNDTLNGNGGNDTLYGGIGNNIIFGGTGNDVLSFASSNVVVSVTMDTATSGNVSMLSGATTFSEIELVTGSIFDDNFVGSAQDDSLDGFLGNDQLEGGDGDDTLDGGLGTDVATYSYASTAIDADLSTGTVIVSGTDTDTLLSIESIIASAQDDTLLGSSGDDDLNGAGGNDTIDGGTGNDILNGGLGDDTIDGGDGNDFISGEDGDDLLDGQLGDDIVLGGDGNDTINSSDGSNFLVGEGGNDIITSTSSVSSVLDGGDGNDVLNGSAVIVTDIFVFTRETGATDTITGWNGVGEIINLLDASFGDLSYMSDLSIVDVAGDAVIDIGAGHTVVVQGITAASLTADNFLGIIDNQPGATLSGSGPIIGAAGWDTITGAATNDLLDGAGGNDDIYGGDGADTLLGGLGDDRLFGQNGDDSIDGGSGIDRITGGDGADTLTGGLGADTFVYTAITESLTGTPDIITDFQVGIDKIDLSGLGYTSALEATPSGTVLGIEFDGTNTLITSSAGGFEIVLNGNYSASGLGLTFLDFVF